MIALVILLIAVGGFYIYSGIAQISEGTAKTLNIVLGGVMLKMLGEKNYRMLFGVVLMILGIYVGISSGSFDF
jgi:hypothetical protein